MLLFPFSFSLSHFFFCYWVVLLWHYNILQYSSFLQLSFGNILRSWNIFQQEHFFDKRRTRLGWVESRMVSRRWGNEYQLQFQDKLQSSGIVHFSKLFIVNFSQGLWINIILKIPWQHTVNLMWDGSGSEICKSWTIVDPFLWLSSEDCYSIYIFLYRQRSSRARVCTNMESLHPKMTSGRVIKLSLSVPGWVQI